MSIECPMTIGKTDKQINNADTCRRCTDGGVGCGGILSPHPCGPVGLMHVCQVIPCQCLYPMIPVLSILWSKASLLITSHLMHHGVWYSSQAWNENWCMKGGNPRETCPKHLEWHPPGRIQPVSWYNLPSFLFHLSTPLSSSFTCLQLCLTLSTHTLPPLCQLWGILVQLCYNHCQTMSCSTMAQLCQSLMMHIATVIRPWHNLTVTPPCVMTQNMLWISHLQIDRDNAPLACTSAFIHLSHSI